MLTLGATHVSCSSIPVSMGSFEKQNMDSCICNFITDGVFFKINP